MTVVGIVQVLLFLPQINPTNQPTPLLQLCYTDTYLSLVIPCFFLGQKQIRPNGHQQRRCQEHETDNRPPEPDISTQGPGHGIRKRLVRGRVFARILMIRRVVEIVVVVRGRVTGGLEAAGIIQVASFAGGVVDKVVSDAAALFAHTSCSVLSFLSCIVWLLLVTVVQCLLLRWLKWQE